MFAHPVDEPRRRFVPLWESLFGLTTLLLPGAAFAWGLTRVSGRPGYVDLSDWRSVPWTLWIIGVSGTIGTVAGLLDLNYHVSGKRLVSRRERYGELIALGLGGTPVFVLMMAASWMAEPRRLLAPIVMLTMFTVVMVCLDEFVYHRRACSRYEATLHRALVFGNGVAFLAWFQWIAGRG
jgi:hypothetical protein